MPTNKAAIDWITRTIAVLGFCCVVTVCALSFMGLKIPPELNTLTGGLVGSLASMLVKTSPTETQFQSGKLDLPTDQQEPVSVTVTQQEPVSVTVTQPTDQPVPVVETPKI